jgi:uncharacterized membrane protein (UPF0127 family)
MTDNSRKAYAFNRTRQTFLATELRVANTHWTRLRGLMGIKPASFGFGQGLWIVPCHGVHTWAMRFPLDLVYLDTHNRVVHLDENVKPWRLAPVRMDTVTVLELPWHTIWNSGTSVGDHIEVELGTSGKDSTTKKVVAA